MDSFVFGFICGIVCGGGLVAIVWGIAERYIW